MCITSFEGGKQLNDIENKKIMLETIWQRKE